MSEQNTLQRIVEIVAKQANTSVGEVTPDTHLINDLGFDSLDVMETVMELEDAFNIGVAEDDIPALATPKLISEYVASRSTPSGEVKP